MFLQGVWFIIAGMLLLGHTPAPAEPYLRVCKNGVIYYYFASREPAQPGRSGGNTAKLRGEAWIQGPSLHPQPPLSALEAPNRVASKAISAATSPPAAPGLSLMTGTSEDLPVVNPPEVKETLGAASRYLLKLLTKLGCQSSPVWPAYDAGPRWVDRKGVPSCPEPRDNVPEVRINSVHYAQEPPPAWGQRQPGSEGANLSSPLRYSFPVAGPFSFRDTWGQYRSGGRHHRAVDIFAWEGTEVYAVTTGVIQTLATLPEAGIILLLRGQDGRGYGYMHLQAYAAGIVEGKVVGTGELLGYVGRTGLQQSAAHLHFQVYTDHRLSKDELLNPYNFLVQLCHGVGVTDLNHHLARLEDPVKVNRIQIYRRPAVTALRTRGGQPGARDSSILVINNF